MYLYLKSTDSSESRKSLGVFAVNGEIELETERMMSDKSFRVSDTFLTTNYSQFPILKDQKLYEQRK
ncbi:hypothetical protein BZZ01_08700 [Nostocales cyanobacterium HT-58-2]|nr:hypothetical protein BZZ01_08700 [Nostocales cyanobacterium HT-58-2]